MLRLACVTVVFAICLKFTAIPFYFSILLACVLYMLTGGWKWLKLFKRDVSLLSIVFVMAYNVIKFSLQKKLLRDLLYANVKKDPNKLAFVDADTKKCLRFKDVEQLSHKIANVFYEAGYRKGDVVALFMENRVEYMPIWVGLSMIGVITSLINYNLRGDSLKHCIEVCNCKSIIFSEETMTSIKELENDLKVEAYCYDTCEGVLPSSWKRLNDLMESTSCLPPPRSPDIKFSDTMLYMYTSGTTGLPKAVIFSGMKIVIYALGGLGGITEKDTLYVALPLYHGNGMIFANMCFFAGGTTIVKKKFSASKYMEDCCKYNVTAINYIGEVCRYILSQPKSVFDEINTIRFAIGNGLRASIWKEFQDRFKIDKITEFYGSTEGNFGLVNTDGRVGAIGHQLISFPFPNNIKLVKMNKDTGEILRDAKGLAVEAAVGEPGQAVGKITKMSKFDGYTNKEANKKKIGHNIFSIGDSGFLTGDILIKDEEGYYYFQDRTGDTFRWKGENVSTNELEGLISNVLQQTDVCVYGVEVPANEGRAGMACIVDPDKEINIEDLPKVFAEILPKYAQPQFLRLSRTAVEVTGTFKFQKNKLRMESYNPDACTDQDVFYYFDKNEKKYLHLDSDAYERIVNQSISF